MGMFDLLQPQTVSIERLNRTGGASKTYTPLASNVKAAVYPASRSTATQYAMRQLTVDNTIYTTTDLAALISGGVLNGDVIMSGGKNYIVMGVREFRNDNFGIVTYELDCQLRQ